MLFPKNHRSLICILRSLGLRFSSKILSPHSVTPLGQAHTKLSQSRAQKGHQFCSCPSRLGDTVPAHYGPAQSLWLDSESLSEAPRLLFCASVRSPSGASYYLLPPGSSLLPWMLFYWTESILSPTEVWQKWHQRWRRPWLPSQGDCLPLEWIPFGLVLTLLV